MPRYALTLPPYASRVAAPGLVSDCRVSTLDLVAGHANRTSICHVFPTNSVRTSTRRYGLPLLEYLPFLVSLTVPCTC